MSLDQTPDGLSFSELVFSDYARFRPGAKPSWLGVLLRIPMLPGLLASIILRAQQCLSALVMSVSRIRCGRPETSLSVQISAPACRSVPDSCWRTRLV